jgi:predicted PurR-regulated permease PerM
MHNMPITVKRAIELIGLFVLGLVIIYAEQIIMPLIMAFFISIVLLPAYRWLRRKKLPETLAIVLSILLFALIIAGVVWFFSSQVSTLITDFPEIKKNVTIHLNSLSKWIDEKTDVSTKQQVDFLNNQSENLLNSAGGMLSGAALSLTSIFIFVGLLPIYVFLMLYYKNLLLRFIFLWFPEKNYPRLEEVVHQTETILKSYIGGLLIQITYITVLLGGALFIIGIKHALLIGVIFAILNLIPYLGALIGNIIGVLLTLTSSQEIWPVFAVLITIAAVQFLDNNILMPSIVGSKVKINALTAIVGVISGGAVAGIAGMFLSLPIIAVLKVIFDHTERFKQWGVLFGDERPDKSPMEFRFFNRTKNTEKKQEVKDPSPQEDNDSKNHHP